MIRGDGYLLNYINATEDLQFLSSKHFSVRPYVRGLIRIHENYNLAYQNCPITKNVRYNTLPSTYKLARNTLFNYYFDKRLSNFCCYCGKNEPERLDHFHPSSSVPQCSLARYNLIRSCGKCNEKKLNRKPISKLNLKHPYLDDVYNSFEILFEVKSSKVFMNNEGLVVVDVDVSAKKNLSRQNKRDVESVLQSLDVRGSVGSRVSIELTNICVHWRQLYRGSVEKRKQYFTDRAEMELSNKHYTEYFCYKILASVKIIRMIDNLIP